LVVITILASPSGEEAGEEKVEEVEPTIEIGGRKYTADEIRELTEKARRYEELLPEFTRRSQKLAELEKQFSQSASPEEQAKVEVLRYLRENMGIVTKQELEEFFSNFTQRLEQIIKEREHLSEAVSHLEKKYDGTVFPKFDYGELRNYLYEKYGQDKSNWPDTIDLEYEYFQMHRDFFEKMPEIRKQAIPTEKKGVPASVIPPAKKVVEKATKEGEISLEDAMLEALGE
jgi:arsenate reductase-like glutaredoxin family protein